MELKLEKKSILYAIAGTVLEWYDFTIYIYLAPILSDIFFPTHDKFATLVSIFAIFFAGYLARPIGGMFFGSLGDRIGRKNTLIISISLMTLMMIITSILPSYALIGIAAPVLLAFTRIFQGFSVGGEYSGVLVILSEKAPEGKRGIITSLGPLVNGFGLIASSSVVAVLYETMTKEQMMTWGWRIPFIIGSIAGIFLVALRTKMTESAHFELLKSQNKLSKSPLREVIAQYPKKILLGMSLSGYGSIVYYVTIAFIPTLLSSYLHVQENIVMMFSTITAIFYTLTAPFWGFISDKFGRKKVLTCVAALIAILIVPLLLLMSYHNLMAILAAEIILTLLAVAFGVSYDTATTELFPTKERFSGMAISYNVGISLLGGISPLICTFLVKLIDSPLAPGYFLIICSLCMLVALTKMKETAFIPLED